jgi:hypothetical protein
MANRQTTFLLKRSNVPGKIPSSSGLTLGELALNTADAKLYTLFTSGTTGATEVREIGWNRISRTGDTVNGNFNFFGDVQISGSSQPGGYALSVTGDTTIGGNLTVTGGTDVNRISGNTSTDMLRITQVGTGRSFVVEDSANPDFTPFQINNQGQVGVGGNLVISTFKSASTVSAYLEVDNTLNGSFNYGIYQGGALITWPSTGIFGSGSGIGGDFNSEGIGVKGSASSEFSGTFGGYFISSGGIDNIGVRAEAIPVGNALQLIDGSEGVGKFLYSVTSDGKSNWTSQLSGTSLTISGNSSSDLVRITQTGSGNTFVVEDSANPDSTPFVIDNSGNVGIGLTIPRQTLDVSGNTIVSGTISGGTMVITTQPTSGYTTTQILMRNSTTGQVEITDRTSPSIYNYGMTYVMTTFNYLT